MKKKAKQIKSNKMKREINRQKFDSTIIIHYIWKV